MTYWHAHVAKHMNMVEGPLWWGPRAPWASPKSCPASIHPLSQGIFSQ